MWMRKEVARFVQAVVGNKQFVVQFEYGKKRQMSDSSLSYVCEKEEVGKEDGETISGLPKRGQVKLLTIDWGAFFKEMARLEN